MKTLLLPGAHATRLQHVRHLVESGLAQPGQFRGKRLQAARHLIAIPLGRRWRALFVQTSTGYQFRDCLSHECYNKINLSAYKP